MTIDLNNLIIEMNRTEVSMNTYIDLGVHIIKESNFGVPDVKWITYNNGFIKIGNVNEQFISIEMLSATSSQTTQKDFGNTVARGILGGVLLGPLGAIGGLLLGRNKSEVTSEYFFKINLNNNKFFIISSPTPYTKFHSIPPLEHSQISNLNEPPKSLDTKTTVPTKSDVQLKAERKLARAAEIEKEKEFEHQREDIRKQNETRAEIEYEKLVDELNKGIEHFMKYVEHLLEEETKDRYGKKYYYYNLMIGFASGRFPSVWIKFKFQEEYKHKFINKKIAEDYFIAFLSKFIIPLYKANEKSAFSELMNAITLKEADENSLYYGGKDGYDFIDKCIETTCSSFAEEFFKDAEKKVLASKKRLFSAKKKHVEKYVLNEWLPYHLYDLAKFYIKGEVCEKNITYAKELLNKSIIVANSKLNGDELNRFLDRSNNLLLTL